MLPRHNIPALYCFVQQSVGGRGEGNVYRFDRVWRRVRCLCRGLKAASQLPEPRGAAPVPDGQPPSAENPLAWAGSRCSPFHHYQKQKRWLSLRQPRNLRQVGQRPGEMQPQVRQQCLARRPGLVHSRLERQVHRQCSAATLLPLLCTITQSQFSDLNQLRHPAGDYGFRGCASTRAQKRQTVSLCSAHG